MSSNTTTFTKAELETKKILDNLTKTFFDLFITKKDGKVALGLIYELFIPQGVIVRNAGETPEIYNLLQFIEPREKLLNEGLLTDFREEELSEKTEIFGNIAHRFSLYIKTGVLSGKPFEIRGMKTIQFIKTQEGWKMCSVAWDDEREGLEIPERYLI